MLSLSLHPPSTLKAICREGRTVRPAPAHTYTSLAPAMLRRSSSYDATFRLALVTDCVIAAASCPRAAPIAPANCGSMFFP
jgi:hypothetical protein